MANFCPQCGSPTDPTKAFCENCGTKLIIFNEPTSPQPVQPEAPVSAPAANLNDGYVIPEESAAPSYPETPQNTYAQNSDFTIPQPSAPQNTAAQNSGFTIPQPSAPQNTGPAPAGPGANPFIQPTQNAGQNTGPFVPPPAKQTGKSGKNLLPIILALLALLVGALYFLMRKTAQDDPKPTISAPEPTPFVISTPDIQIPTPPAISEPVHTDVPQGLNAGADFIKYDIPCDMEINKEYQYPGVYDDTQETVYGTLTFLQYDTEPADAAIISFGKENNMDLEGYRVHTLISQVDFTQPDAYDRGVLVTRYTGDYYDLDLLTETFETLTDTYEEDYYRYEVDFNGERKYIYYYVESDWNYYDTYLEYSETTTFLIPDGYDGVVRGFVYPQMDDPTTDNSPEHNFLFRLSPN